MQHFWELLYYNYRDDRLHTKFSLYTLLRHMHCMCPQPICDPIPSINVEFIQSLCLLNNSMGRNLSNWPWWGLLRTHGQILRPVRPISWWLSQTQALAPRTHIYKTPGFSPLLLFHPWFHKMTYEVLCANSPLGILLTHTPEIQDSFKCALSPSLRPQGELGRE